MNSPTCPGHMGFTCWVWRDKAVITSVILFLPQVPYFHRWLHTPTLLSPLLYQLPRASLSDGCASVPALPFGLHTHTQIFLCPVYKLALHKNFTYGMRARNCWEQYIPECISMGAGAVSALVSVYIHCFHHLHGDGQVFDEWMGRWIERHMDQVQRLYMLHKILRSFSFQLTFIVLHTHMHTHKHLSLHLFEE